MQTARQLQALTGSAANGLGPSNILFAMERAMGVAQVRAVSTVLSRANSFTRNDPPAPRLDCWYRKAACQQ